MKIGKIKYSVLDLWGSRNYIIKRELESLEQYYCLEVYQELSNIIDNHKDLKRFTDCGVLLLSCSDFDFDCSSLRSRIRIFDLFRRHDIILEFKSDGILLTKPLIYNPELNDTIFYLYDNISKCIVDLKYKILPEFSLILSRSNWYLFKTASTLLEKEFGTEYFNVGHCYPDRVTINILGRPSIYIDFESANCSVSLYRSEFIDTLPSSFTTIDEWEKYLAKLVSNFIV